MKKITKLILCSLLVISIASPLQVEAKTTHHSSSHVSIHKSSTKSKSSRPKITKTKKATKTYRTNKSIKKKIKLKKQVNKKTQVPNKQAARKDKKTTTYNYYNSYNSNRYYTTSSSGLSFWDYYMLGHLFNNNNKVSEQDIARELQKQGYSKQETDNILRKANQNQAKKEEKKKRVMMLIFSVLGALFIIGLGLIIFIKRESKGCNKSM
ncbi:TPA: hypothetical protein KOP07_003688 [Clostridioides difficile]|uniref:hypothetical protein n=1 Tax=Clostridioides difficile TaxID=1496 RepID=UPI0007BC0C78|nr:hypothetical protein [Clostridioides difficile]MBY1383093.1 hypothetical protein [Clostridioides difficile]MCR1683226.1 hypothetical protein [Clostridioides difficile]MDC9392482.1 hypothetical protein [Clostridioides difficile]MDK1637610.1 hypothetical protein [Clostridioides difficile]CZR82982.1 hypothetical protein CDFC105_43864 [Clostridioides difficile]